MAQRKVRQDQASDGGPYQVREFDLTRLEGLSAKAIETHLGLYKGYVEKLNELAGNGVADSPEKAAARIRNFAFEHNGVVLHELFFEQLAGPRATQLRPGGVISEAADISFGGTDQWSRDIAQLAETRGVGWVATVRDPSKNRIYNTWIDLHHLSMPAGGQLLFVLDFWEHAYLLDFEPKERSEYFQLLWKQIDWAVVEGRAR